MQTRHLAVVLACVLAVALEMGCGNKGAKESRAPAAGPERAQSHQTVAPGQPLPPKRPVLSEPVRAHVEAFGRARKAHLEEAGRYVLEHCSEELVRSLLAWYEWFTVSQMRQVEPGKWMSVMQGQTVIDESGSDASALDVAAAMKRTMERIDSPSAMPALIEALGPERNGDVRLIALTALGNMRGPRVFEAVKAQLDDPLLGVYARNMLGDLGTPEQVTKATTGREPGAAGSPELSRELAAACRAGDVQGVKEALRKGADINGSWRGATGGQPLYVAIENRKLDVAKLLLDRGASPNAVDDGPAPLTMAVHVGDPALFQYMLEKGADPNGKDNRGVTALQLAQQTRNERLVAMLLESSQVKPAASAGHGDTPLNLAVRRGSDISTAEKLLEKGADPNSPGEGGCTALHVAVGLSGGGLEFAKLLLRHGADPNHKDARGDTPLHTLLRNETKDTAMLKLLLDSGADVNARGNAGETALHLARSQAMVDLLVCAGAEINAMDDKGRGPLLAVGPRLGDKLRLLGARPGKGSSEDQRLLSEPEKAYLRRLTAHVLKILAGGNRDALWDASDMCAKYRAFLQENGEAETRRRWRVQSEADVKEQMLAELAKAFRPGSLRSWDMDTCFFQVEPVTDPKAERHVSVYVVVETEPGPEQHGTATQRLPWSNVRFLNRNGAWYFVGAGTRQTGRRGDRLTE